LSPELDEGSKHMCGLCGFLRVLQDEGVVSF
jgi:hypothetical protein